MNQVELYRMIDGVDIYTMTSGDTEVDYGGETYVPHVIGRTGAESKNELSRSNIETNFGMDDIVARKYLSSIVDGVITLTIFMQEAETGTVSVVWKGRLSAVKPGTSTIKLVWESVFTSLRRPGLRRRFQRNCGHVLYGRGCGLNKDDFEVAGTVTAVSGTMVTCAAAAGFLNGYFTGGIIKAPDGTLRFIISHYGNQLALIRAIDSLTLAIIGGPQAVSLYPGCDRADETCDTKFNNFNNNGSFRYIPIRNPYGGSTIT